MYQSFAATLSFCLLFFVTALMAQQNAGNDIRNNIEKIDHRFDSASREYRFNGVVFIAQKGKVLLNKGYGWRDVKSKTLLDSSTIFQIGSVTKQFTATIILKLQEEGKLSVHDPLSKFFPDYSGGDKITIYHLLTHTSGIPDYTKNISPFMFLVKKSISHQHILNIFKDKQLDCEPGTAFHYSSSNYYLLGLIIEKITGKPYEQVVHETIFNPLQMTHSGFDFRNLSSPFKATGYSVFYNGRQTEARDMDSTVTYAAGGIYSTVGDLYKWIKAVSGTWLLTSASWQQAFTPYKGCYGFGWAIDTLYGKKYIAHTGVTANFGSLILYYPDEDISIILLSNTMGLLWNEGVDISQMLFNQPHPWGNASEVTIDSVILSQYTGSYSYDESHNLFVSIQNGKLLFNGTPNTGISNTYFIALSDTRFYNRRLRLEVQFIKDSDGKVLSFDSKAGEWRINWKRLE
jgi:CubicO group peptidase (beta-lactamase class C family)